MKWISELIFGNNSSEATADTINIFIWIFVIIGLAIIIWILTRTEFTSFLRGNIKKTEFNFSDIEEDIAGINFNDRIAKALNDNNYRLAIRWHYLQLLNKLNEQGLIKYEPFKTNIDYAIELGKSKQNEAFKNSSNIYDYVWYGNYNIDKTSYDKFKDQFNVS